MKPSEVMPLNQRRRRHQFRLAAEEKPHQFDETDAEPEGDEKLVLVRTMIEVADDDALHHHAQNHHE